MQKINSRAFSLIETLVVVSVIAVLAGLFAPRAQAQSFSFLGTNVTGWLKNLQPFTTNRAALFQAGAGMNTGTKRLVAAGALTIPTSQYTAVGIVGGWSPHTSTVDGIKSGGGLEYGSVTLEVGITNNLEISAFGFDIGIGQVHSFVEDGPLHNWKSGATGNFFGTGMEKSWTINKYMELGCGVLVDNDSTRSGIDIIPGGHFQIHGANAVPLNLHAAAAHEFYAFKRFLNPGEF